MLNKKTVCIYYFYRINNIHGMFFFFYIIYYSVSYSVFYDNDFNRSAKRTTSFPICSLTRSTNHNKYDNL